MTEKTYVSRHAANLQIRLVVNKEDVDIQFVNKLFTTEDEDVIAAFDAVLAKRPHLSREISALDKAGAEAVLKEQLANKRASAFAGGASTAMLDAIKSQAPIVQANALLSGGASPKAATQTAEQIAAGAQKIVGLNLGNSKV